MRTARQEQLGKALAARSALCGPYAAARELREAKLALAAMRYRQEGYAPVYGLMVRYRPYQCQSCGHMAQTQTNHTGTVAAWCAGCSWMVSGYPIAMMYGGRAYRSFAYVGGAVADDEINPHAMGAANG